MGRQAASLAWIAALATGGALAGGCGPDDVLRVLSPPATAQQPRDADCVTAWNTSVPPALRAEALGLGSSHVVVRAFAASATVPPARTGCAFRFLGSDDSAVAVAYIDDGVVDWPDGLEREDGSSDGQQPNATLAPDGGLYP